MGLQTPSLGESFTHPCNICLSVTHKNEQCTIQHAMSSGEEWDK